MRDQIIRQCAVRGIVLSRYANQSEDLRLWYGPPTSTLPGRLVLARASVDASTYCLDYMPIEDGVLPAQTCFSEYHDWVSRKAENLPLTTLERNAVITNARDWDVEWKILDAGIPDVLTIIVSTRWAKAKEPRAWIKRETVNVTRKQLRELGNFFLEKASKT